MLPFWNRMPLEGRIQALLQARPTADALAAGERIQMHPASVSITAAGLYDRHLRDVYRYVSRRIPRREDAEDITAEVFQAAFRCLNRLRDTDNPRVWLFGIARRKVVDHLRRAGRTHELLNCDVPESTIGRLESAAGDPAIALHRAESRQTIRRLLSNLSEDHREALVLQYVEGLSIAEVAQVMDRSLAATNSLLQRARAAVFREGQFYFLNTDSALTDDGRRMTGDQTTTTDNNPQSAIRNPQSESVTRHPSSVIHTEVQR